MGVRVNQARPSNFQAPGKFSFTFHFWHKSFILDEWKLVELSNNSFEWKNVTFWGQTILWPLIHIFRGSRSPTSPGSTPLILLLVTFAFYTCPSFGAVLILSSFPFWFTVYGYYSVSITFLYLVIVVVARMQLGKFSIIVVIGNTGRKHVCHVARTSYRFTHVSCSHLSIASR